MSNMGGKLPSPAGARFQALTSKADNLKSPNPLILVVQIYQALSLMQDSGQLIKQVIYVEWTPCLIEFHRSEYDSDTPSRALQAANATLKGSNNSDMACVFADLVAI